MTRAYIIGIDEVGRGPLAGPLVVSACAIEVGCSVLSLYPKEKLLDSKKLTTFHRKAILFKARELEAKEQVVFGLGEVSNERIDEVGLTQAIKEALLQALEALHVKGVSQDSYIYLDGSLKAPPGYKQETIIKGDEKIEAISLASIYAKEYRDDLMKNLALQFPEYHFEKHVGYGTRLHVEAIHRHGITPLHRTSFLKHMFENEIKEV